MEKLTIVSTKAICTNMVTRKGNREPCGWRPTNVVSGTTHVKCLDCKATIEVPEMKGKSDAVS